MLQKPNTKNLTKVAIATGSLVVGAKLGDAVVSIMPDSVASYKKIGIGVLSIVAAACINTTTTTGQAAQAGLLGMGGKQLIDVASEHLSSAVPAKDGGSVTDKFINGFVGHKETEVALLGSPYTDWSSYKEPQTQPQMVIGV